MGYTITGRLLDQNKQPIEFGLVYASDANGKPVDNTRNMQTDDKGRWKLDNITDKDYITGRMVGYNQKTTPSTAALSIPNVITGLSSRQLVITLPEDAKASLPEVVVQAPKINTKSNDFGKYIMIGGAVLLGIGIVAYGIKAIAANPLPKT